MTAIEDILQITTDPSDTRGYSLLKSEEVPQGSTLELILLIRYYYINSPRMRSWINRLNI